MSILDLDKEDDLEPVDPSPAPVTKAPKDYQTIATESTQVDRKAVTMFMEGSTWEVRYYQQLLGKDDEPTAQALDRDAVYQQYRRIDKLKLKVTDPVSFNAQDQTPNIFNISGAAGLIGIFPPNVGDMFVADGGDGRNLIFAVTSARRSTVLMSSVYNIEYKAVSYWNAEREADFERKTVAHLVFDANGLLNGCGAFVTPEEAKAIETYKEVLRTLLDQYLADFFSRDLHTLIVPDQLARTYDHFVVRFMLRLFDVNDDPRIRDITEYNVSGDRLLTESKTIWDALLQRTRYPLLAGVQHAAITDTRTLRGRPELQALGYMGLPQMVYPVETNTGVDARYRNRDLEGHVYEPFETGKERRRDEVAYERTPTVSELAPQVNQDSYYVFTKAFYRQQDGKSILEYVADQAINRTTIDLRYINRLIESPWSWSNLERFYYYPVLMYLLKIIVERKNGSV